MPIADFGLELLSPYKGWELFDFNISRLNEWRDYFSTLWICDHFQYAGNNPWFEGSTTLAFLAAKFPEYKLGNLVLCAGYRNPAVVAKMASTLQYLTGGRFILGIGAGWQKEEYEAYGYEFPDYSERVARLQEAVQIMKLLWNDSPATFEGKYYRIRNAYCEPRPKDKIPILIGADGKRALAVVAKYADMWNESGGMEVFKPAYEKLARACFEAGRDLREIKLTCLVTPHFPEDPRAFKQNESKTLLGPNPEDVIAELRELVDLGVSHFQVRCYDRRSVEIFTKKVIPSFDHRERSPS
jgi:alkanesulfonate monooxygenase SsuD/methylene tetrahydromethanopterin reductase-like flavin-dependent oxidoreductase (luciferase family)